MKTEPSHDQGVYGLRGEHEGRATRGSGEVSQEDSDIFLGRDRLSKERGREAQCVCVGSSELASPGV